MDTTPATPRRKSRTDIPARRVTRLSCYRLPNPCSVGRLARPLPPLWLGRRPPSRQLLLSRASSARAEVAAERLSAERGLTPRWPCCRGRMVPAPASWLSPACTRERGTAPRRETAPLLLSHPSGSGRRAPRAADVGALWAAGRASPMETATGHGRTRRFPCRTPDVRAAGSSRAGPLPSPR